MLDVDAMSSDGCPVHMLSEGEYIIHISNEGHVFFSLLHVALLRSGIWVDNIALSQWSKFQLKIAWKFSTLPGKMLGSFRSQLGPKTQPISLGMFYGPSSQPSPGSSEEILLPISEMYRAIRVPFGDHKC